MVASNPLISIVMPTCRRPALLRRAIRSVVTQTFERFELIVVDDGCDEETVEIVKSFQDERIVLVRHERNRGAAAAYNTGIRASRGEWVSFLDDDDEYLPHFMETTLEFLRRADPPVGFVWSGIQWVMDTPEGEFPTGRTYWPPHFQSREQAICAATSIGNGHGLTVRRTALENAGYYDESYPVCEDTEFLFRLAPRAAFAVIPEPLVKIHRHEGGQLTDSGRRALRLECHERLIRRHRDVIERYPGLCSVHFKVLAGLSYQMGLRSRGRGWLLQMFSQAPLNITILADWVSYELFGVNLRTWLRRTRLGSVAKRWTRRIAGNKPT